MLTEHLERADLRHERGRVDLAHVEAAVAALHLRDVQHPRVGVVLHEPEARDARNHPVVDGEDHLPLQVDPGHLSPPGQNGVRGDGASE